MVLSEIILASGFLLAALIAFVTAISQFSDFRSRIARWSAFFLLGISINLFCYYSLRFSPVPGLGKILVFLQVTGYFMMDICYIGYIIHFCGRTKWINVRNIFLVILVPAVVTGMLLYRWESLPGSLFSAGSSFGVDNRVIRAPGGALEQLFVWYSNFAGFFTIALLLRLYQDTTQHYRRTIVALLGGTILLVTAGWLEMTGANPVPHLSILQMVLALVVIPFVYILLRWKSLTAIPVNIQIFKDCLRDGFIIIDSRGIVVDFNPAVQNLIGRDARLETGVCLNEIFPQLKLSFTSPRAIQAVCESRRILETAEYTLEINACPIEDSGRELVGTILTFHNVSEQEVMETMLRERRQTLARTNAVMQALAEANLEIQEAGNLSSIYAALDRHLKKLELDCFLVQLDSGSGELVLEYITPQAKLVERIEKTVGFKVTGFRFKRESFPRFHAYLDNDTEDYYRTTFTGEPVYKGIDQAWIFKPALRLIGIKGDEPIYIFRLLAGNKKIGLLGIWGKGLCEEAINPMRIFAGQVAWGIERMNLYNQEAQRAAALERSNQIISTLAIVSASMGRAADSLKALETLGEELEHHELHCVLGTLDDRREALTFQYASFGSKMVKISEQLSGFTLTGYRLPRALWPGERVVNDGVPFWYENIPAVFGSLFPAVPEKLFKAAVQQAGITAEDRLCVLPLITGGRVTGILSIWGKNLEDRDTPALMVFAQQVAQFLSKTREKEEESARANSLARTNSIITALSNVAASLETTANLANVLQTLGMELQKVGIQCMVGTLDDAKQNLYVDYLSISTGLLAFANKLGFPWMEDIVIPRHLWPTDRAVVERTPVWDPDPVGSTQKMFPFIPKIIFSKTFETAGVGQTDKVCYLPMISEEDVIGILAVWGHDLEEDDIPSLSVFSNQVATAIRNTRLYNQAREEIHNRKKAEEKIQAALAEKEILLKEIHHRVKNNLQIISSLLYLQMAQTSDANAIEVLSESQNRVRAMSLIHEKLYQSHNLAQIDLSSYLDSLVKFLSQSYGQKQKQISLQVRIDDIQLDLDTAIPCGLIVNELVSNAFKYAFQGQKSGTITVICRQVEEGDYLLLIADNGVGLPENLDVIRSKSLGLQLVDSLVEQISGQMKMEARGGTRFEIRFPARRE